MPPATAPLPLRVLLLVLKVALPLLVLWLALKAGRHLIETSPHADREAEAPRVARLVEVAVLAHNTHPVEIEAMGTVIPAREVDLQSQVAGRVIAVNPSLVPGGRLQEGEWVAELEPEDFDLLVRQREAAVAMARARLDLELGQQLTARQELEIIGEKLEAEEERLVLRMPQMESARADLDAALAALDAARLDRARARVTAPFNAVVLSHDIEVGSQISPNTTIARLAGTDRAWIELATPTDDLRWIRFPEEGAHGSDVRARDAAWENGGERHGRVIQLAGELNPASRTARVLVEVADPLALASDEPPLLFNSYVRAVITGPELDHTFRLARRHLREGNSVWLMTPDNRLEIRPVNVLHRGNTHVLVRDGLEPGERLVASDIRTPVPGMSLRASTPEADAPPLARGPAAPDPPPERSPGT